MSSNTETKKEIVVIELNDFPAIQKQIEKKVAVFTAYEPKLDELTQLLTAITSVSSPEEKARIQKVIKQAKAALKKYEDLRLEFTRPMDEMKNAALVYQRGRSNELGLQTLRLSTLVSEYDQKVRLEKEAELEAKRKEQERVHSIKQSINDHVAKWLTDIQQASFASIEEMKVSIGVWDYEQYQEFADEARTALQNIPTLIEQKKHAMEESVRLYNAQQEQRKKEEELKKQEQAVQDQQEAEAARKQQEEQAALQLKLKQQEEEEQARKAEAEEQARIAQQKREQEALELKFQQDKENRKLFEDAIKSGIKEVTILDVGKVPETCLTVKVKTSAVMKILKREKTVSGLQITMNNGKIF